MSRVMRRGRQAIAAALAHRQRRTYDQRVATSLLVRSSYWAAPLVAGELRWNQPKSRLCSTSSRVVVPKNEKDELFLKALRVHYEREGHFFVPTDFVVPSASAEWPEELWGVPLGLRLRNFARGISNHYKRAMLKSVGFPYDDWKTYVWEEQLLPSLSVFKEMEGHTFVRFPYVVPENDDRFPKCAWGFKLGFAVALLRQQREALTPSQLERLNEIDFIWTENHYKLKILFLPAMRRFKEIFRHTEVPNKFVVPENTPQWDASIGDTKLGYLYNSLKGGSFDPETIEDCASDLKALGLFEAETAEHAWRTVAIPALTTFVEIHGHVDIPSDFVVPSEAPWPEKTWDWELGYVVRCILKEGMFSEQVQNSKAELRELGYRWDVLFGRWARQLLPAMRTYKQLYGHCDVPPTFIVPSDSPWPEESRKYHLGRQIQLIRKLGRSSTDVVDAVDELHALGFKFNILDSDFKEKILPALHIYAKMFGHCDVPRGFVVPSDEPWPVKSWGTKLGAAASAIRARKQYRKQVDEHREELKSLGFTWHLPHTMTGVDREVVQPCIAIFKEIYGEETMPDPEFVVPANDTRWPVEASGFKLGRWLQAHSRRRRMSDDGIIMDPSPRRSHRRVVTLEPHQEQYWNEVLMASFKAYAETHGGSCKDMDDNFIVPDEAPYPQIAWGLNLGLRLRYVRHHDRYAAEVEKYRLELESLGVLSS